VSGKECADEEFIMKLIFEGDKKCRPGIQPSVKQMGYTSIIQEPGEIALH
jgi:hypothetical protein